MIEEVDVRRLLQDGIPAETLEAMKDSMCLMLNTGIAEAGTDVEMLCTIDQLGYDVYFFAYMPEEADSSLFSAVQAGLYSASENITMGVVTALESSGVSATVSAIDLAQLTDMADPYVYPTVKPVTLEPSDSPTIPPTDPPTNGPTIVPPTAEVTLPPTDSEFSAAHSTSATSVSAFVVALAYYLL